jgi:hypothetical protein
VAVADPVGSSSSLAVPGAATLALHGTHQDAVVRIFASLIAVNVTLLHRFCAG